MNSSHSDNCPHCSKPKTLHLTQVIGGKVIKENVCPNCGKGKLLAEGLGFDLIEKPLAAMEHSLACPSGVFCPECGLTPKDFKEHGRLGCPACYEVYEEKLVPLYRKLHKGAEHLGKSPKGQARFVSLEKIEALKVRMNEYVVREEYELAAVVRDQLRSLEG